MLQEVVDLAALLSIMKPNNLLMILQIFQNLEANGITVPYLLWNFFFRSGDKKKKVLFAWIVISGSQRQLTRI